MARSSLTEHYQTLEEHGLISRLGIDTAALARHNFEQFFPARDRACLDIGPGRGEVLRIWRDMGYERFTGVDLSLPICEQLWADGLPCEHVTDTTAYLNEHEEHYEFILASDVLEHVPPAEIFDFARAIEASLTPGGQVVFKVPNAQSPHFGLTRYGDITHHWAFTEGSLSQLLGQAGFDRVWFLPERYPFALTKSWMYNVLAAVAQHIIAPVSYLLTRLNRLATFGHSPAILTQCLIAQAIKKERPAG